MEEQNKYTQAAEEQEPGSFRLIITLSIAGLFSGLLLVGVYLWAKPIIEENRAEDLREAIYRVLPGTASYQSLELKDTGLEAVDEKPSSDPQDGEERPVIFAGYDDSGHLVGFAIQTSEPGFQEEIKGIFGYDPREKMIIGYEVLESKETPGLGDKIIKDEKFRDNFQALKVEPRIEYVKKGQKRNANEIEGITGATISSKAVHRMIQNGLERWRPEIEAYLKSTEK